MKRLVLGICGLCFCLSATAMEGQKVTVKDIPGYTYGHAKTSPVTLRDLEGIKKSLLFTDEDIKYLKMSQSILDDQREAILDVWYNFVATTPELVASFKNTKTGEPDGEYLKKVRARFSQWILDTAAAEYDQKWLNYQNEIGLRHSPTKKNKTDGVKSTKAVPFRHLVALTVPITTTLKPFLAKKGATADDVEKMHAAWVKSVTLQTILWSHSYIKPGLF